MLVKLRRILAMNNRQWRVIFQAIVLLPFIAFGLKLFGFKRISRFLNFNFTDVQSTPDNYFQAKEIASLVIRTANNLPIHTSCLVRSLVLWRILKNHNIESELVIGVGKPENNQLAAHAWIEYAGTPLAERGDITTLYSRIFASNIQPENFS